MLTRCDNCFSEYEEGLGLCPYCGYIPGEDTQDVYCLSPGTILAGRYIIGKKLGMGGFGITYKAWDCKLETVMAIKEYFPSGLVNRLPNTSELIIVSHKHEQDFLYGKNRFVEEARNLAKFNSHPNIVNVFEYFEANNTAYIVMEFLEGKTIGEVVKEQNGLPLPYEQCVDIAVSLCTALRAIHKVDILHRDISPNNIMLCNDGKIKLFDFGAARFASGIESLTIEVKPGFTPPEQYNRIDRQGPSTDIYALGATLYYALTGEIPVEATDRKRDHTLPPPEELNPGIPHHISETIMRAMAVEAQYRFHDVDDFEKCLLQEKRIRSEKEERKRRRIRQLLGISASLIIVVGIGAITLLTYFQASDSALPDANLILWYATQEANNTKGEALTAIVDSFTDGYQNIDIVVEPAEQSELSSDLRGANIVETTNMYLVDQDSSLISLDDLSDDLGSDFYVQDALSVSTKYPTGIIVPVIYVNSGMGELSSTESLEQIQTACTAIDGRMAVSREGLSMYGTLYGEDVSAFCEEDALDAFISRDAFIYLGTSCDYFDIQESMPGEYTVMLPNCGISVYQYGMEWSIVDGEDTDEEASKGFLSYLTSELAQEYLYVQNRSVFLPISKSVMEVYLTVYSELEGIAEYLELPFTAPSSSPS